MNTKEIRDIFLKYFVSNGHKLVPSSSLVPRNDASLLFTNAGMVQFKKIFTGEEKIDYTRACSSQKCVRAGGKHNDLENVGYTKRHHTFFEMLGNFSFGDYFKKKAIQFAWELLIEQFKLPMQNLWFTVFKDDDEAYNVWKNDIHVPSSHIVKMGEKDNFWSMGDTGPCGPCSEIIFDQGESVPCDNPDDGIGSDCDRYLEIWNLVFMQYNKLNNGSLVPLPKPSIDTGMGLERLSAVLCGVKSNYEIDIFKTIIQSLSDLLHVKYEADKLSGTALRVISDHIRAAVFLISDGVFPSNEQRGYVLRRILRRALRYAFMIGMREPKLYNTVDPIIQLYKDTYTELIDHKGIITTTIKDEEDKFLLTLERGLSLIDEYNRKLISSGSRVIDGQFAFKLYDTYGFPVDILSDIAKENGLSVEYDVFNQLMEQQRKKAKEASKFIKTMDIKNVSSYNEIISKIGETTFVGYKRLTLKTDIEFILKDEKLVNELKEGEQGVLVFKETPFYAESGGQVGDQGMILSSSNKFVVLDTVKPYENIIAHVGKVEHGHFAVNQRVELVVNKEIRQATTLNHTATHLLQAALKKIIGSHVAQSGSYVSSTRFRFDFLHNRALTNEELSNVEALVNQWIRENHEVNITFSSLDDAVKEGAIALFDEKYKDIVRVVTIDKISKELCGGTHIKRTGDIGLFIITKESSVSQGVRRIEAITGDVAYKFVKERIALLKEIALTLATSEANILQVLNKQKQLIKERDKADTHKLQSMEELSDEIVSNSISVNGIKVVKRLLDKGTLDDVRRLSDTVKQKLKSGIGALGININNKANIVVFVTNDLTERFDASLIAKQLANIVGGSGGGRKDFAQAGGSMVDNLGIALDKLIRIIQE